MRRLKARYGAVENAAERVVTPRKQTKNYVPFTDKNVLPALVTPFRHVLNFALLISHHQIDSQLVMVSRGDQVSKCAA